MELEIAFKIEQTLSETHQCNAVIHAFMNLQPQQQEGKVIKIEMANGKISHISTVSYLR